MAASQPNDLGFQSVQREFANYIRSPEKNAMPEGMEARRMKIYRDLFYNNVQSTLSSAFPVFRKICDEAIWQNTVQAFFESSRCESPYLRDVPEDFVSFLQDTPCELTNHYPFALELIHYEWVELALDVLELEGLPEGVDPNGSLLDEHPLLWPAVWSLAYTYPVHHISVDYIPTEPSAEPLHLLVYRNRQDIVKFMEINGLTARMIYLLSEDAELSGRDVLLNIAAEIGHPEPEQVVAGGLQILEQLKAQGVLAGTLKLS